jgi:hypothetical protein
MTRRNTVLVFISKLRNRMIYIGIIHQNILSTVKQMPEIAGLYSLDEMALCWRPSRSIDRPHLGPIPSAA